MTTQTITPIDAFVRIETIRVVGRHRRHLGDLDSLMRSITEVDLLNPITLTRDSRLVAGERRLEACRRLGWDSVPVRFVDSLNDAAKLLAAERDENIERKEMLPSELASLGEALYEFEQKAAKERQREAGRTNGRGIACGSAATSYPEESGRTRERVGEALGMSPRLYAYLRAAHRLANDTEAPEPERAVAREALDEMDRTGHIYTAAERMTKRLRAKQDAQEAKAAAIADPEPEPTETDKDNPDWIPDRGDTSPRAAKQRRRLIRGMAERGYSSVQIGERIHVSDKGVRKIARTENIRIPADEALGRGHIGKKIDSNRIIRETVASVEGVEVALDLVNYAELDRSEIPNWTASLSDSIAALNRLKKRLLKEMAQ